MSAQPIDLYELFEAGWMLHQSLIGSVHDGRDVCRLTTCDFWPEYLRGMHEGTDLHVGLTVPKALVALKGEVRRRLADLASPPKAVAPVKHPSVSLSGYQLLQALDFTWPDRGSSHDFTKDQGECEATIGYFDAHEYVEDNATVVMPAGMYVYATEYPEDGQSFLIDDAAAAPVAQALPVAEKDSWISIEDELPTDETDVLVKCIRHSSVYYDIAGLFNGQWQSQVTERECRRTVIAWKPINAAIAAMQGEKK